MHLTQEIQHQQFRTTLVQHFENSTRRVVTVRVELKRYYLRHGDNVFAGFGLSVCLFVCLFVCVSAR